MRISRDCFGIISGGPAIFRSVRCVLAVLVLCLPLAANGEPKQGFITDQVEVELRAGQGSRYKLVKRVGSGTSLTVLGENRKTGYSSVKLDSGEQGWILTKYLSDEPPAQFVLNQAQAEIRKLKAELVAARAVQNGGDRTTQGAEIKRLNTELIAVRQASASALRIQQQRDQLQEKVIDLESDLETVRREKNALGGDSQDWFLLGAGVLFAGILLGLLLPKLGWRKRSHWDSF